MNVILYMAMSANGLIAETSDNTDWVSDLEWKNYLTQIKHAGNVVIGRRTYEIQQQQGDFAELSKCKIIVVSNHDFQTSELNHVVVPSPQAALTLLNSYKEVVVAGGATLNSAFLSQGLIHEIYLDVEPIILNQGIPLFSHLENNQNLKLLHYRVLGKDLVQLHYKVL